MQKNNFLSFILAGVVGGAMTLGGTQLLNRYNGTNGNAIPSTSVRGVNNESNFSAAGSTDLTTAASAASPSVVFIQAAESKQSAQQRQERMYADDPFAFFFGGRGSGQRKGTGSGVILTNDGYIVTNNHVVDFADQVQVTLSDNRKFTAKVVGTDPSTDLAVLKIEGSSLPAIRKGNSDDTKIGEWVLAIGNPFDLGSTVTAGIISAKGKKIGVNERRDAIESFLQTDAAVNPGNSGGALVDAQGRLVGINTAISSHSGTGTFEGYSFAIPVNLMSRVVDDIIKNGSFKRAYLGVNIIDQKYFEDYVKEYQLGVTQGVIVGDVESGGSAQLAGIVPQDVITAVNGKAIKANTDLFATIASMRAGDVANLTIVRKGNTMEVPVRLREMKMNRG